MALCLFTSFLLGACGNDSGRFRLEGHFKNLNQGEFYLYSIETGTKDTIVVNDGRFVYDRSLRDTVTYMLLFPNYSEMPIFARPGAKVVVEGDVTHLRETSITGTDENESMTAFRKKTVDMMPPDVQKAALHFIEEQPASQVGLYLLRRYVLLSADPDYEEAFRLCSLMHKAQPQSQHLARLESQLQALVANKPEGRLPDFAAVSTKGDSVGNAQLRAEANIIVAWAAWNNDSQPILRQLARKVKSEKGRVAVVSICLDASPSEGRLILERDSIAWPNICDSMLWQSPLLSRLGIATLPANILTDKKGNILGRNMKESDLMAQIDSLLK